MLVDLVFFGYVVIGVGAAIGLRMLRTPSTGCAAKPISSTVVLFDLLFFGFVVIGVRATISLLVLRTSSTGCAVEQISSTVMLRKDIITPSSGIGHMYRRVSGDRLRLDAFLISGFSGSGSGVCVDTQLFRVGCPHAPGAGTC